MNEYDVKSRFLLRRTGDYVDPPGPVPLADDEAKGLIASGCISGVAVKHAKQTKKTASRKGTKRGTENPNSPG